MRPASLHLPNGLAPFPVGHALKSLTEVWQDDYLSVYTMTTFTLWCRVCQLTLPFSLSIIKASLFPRLDVLCVINEPTAAALAYSMDQSDENVMAVNNSASGTLYISTLKLQNGVFKVKSTNGDTHLGDEDFNITLFKNILAESRKDTSVDLSGDPMAVQRV